MNGPFVYAHVDQGWGQGKLLEGTKISRGSGGGGRAPWWGSGKPPEADAFLVFN